MKTRKARLLPDKGFAKFILCNMNNNVYEFVRVYASGSISIKYLYQDAFKQRNRKGYPGVNLSLPIAVKIPNPKEI